MAGLTIPPNILGTNRDDVIAATEPGISGIGIKIQFDRVLNTGGGDDAVFGSATGEAGHGIVADGHVSLASGDDAFTGIGAFGGFQISSAGTLDAGSGDDTILGVSDSTGFPHNSFGIIGLDSIDAGSGDDLIVGEARGIVPGNVSQGLVVTGGLDGGAGDDTIIGVGINENGLGSGLVSSLGAVIEGGNGGDVIAGYGTSAGIGYQFSSTIIDGGNGDDYVKARIIDASGAETPGQGGAIANALVIGGRGDDVFDVGYGNATVDGGQGFDRLLLPGLADDHSLVDGMDALLVERDGFVLTVLNVEAVSYLGALIG